MVKIAASAAMSEYIPTVAREGSRQSIGAVAAVAFMQSSRSFVEPVRSFRVLQVPQRPAALHHRNCGEVVFGRRRRGSPLQGPCVPRIAVRLRSPEVRAEDVEDEGEDSRGLEDEP